jgi:uncharacterized protein YoaH (UPF0181 family)
MLGKLFNRTPKWQHRDEKVRLKAVAQMGNEEGGALHALVEQDPSVEVRVQAVARVANVDYLISLLGRQPPPKVKVREAIRKRIVELLDSPEGEEVSPQNRARLKRLVDTQEKEILTEVALNFPNPAVREIACRGIREESLLMQVITSDKVASVRQTALEQVTSGEALAQVAKEMRKRDKQLAKRAKERLAAIEEEQQRPQRIAAEALGIIEQVAKLGLSKRWDQDDAKLGYLNERWQQLRQEAGELLIDEQQRFTAACEKYQQAAAAYHEEQQRRLADEQAVQEAVNLRRPLLTRLEMLVERLDQQAGLPSESLVDELRREFQQVRQEWEELVGPLPVGFPKETLASYEQLSRRLSKGLAVELERREAATVAEQMCQRLEQELSQDRVLHAKHWEKRLAALDGHIQSLPKGEAREALRERSKVLREGGEARLTKQRRKADDLHAGLDKRFGELDQALEAGNSREASLAHDRIQQAIQYFDSTAEHQNYLKEARQRLNALRPRFDEMRKWRDWAVVNEREKLCEEMEALVGLNAHPTTLAEQIKGLQDQWKRLDATRATAPNELWQRFKGAADEAYKPVARYREQQALERQQHAQQRQALITEIGEWLDQVDWSHIDWKDVQKQERDFAHQWREMGQVTHADWKRLNGEFRRQMDRFEERLGPERERCRKQRSDLIEELERLAENQQDNADAVEQAKGLQRRWQVTVSGRKRDENAMWKRYRAALDRIFEQRREAQQAQQQERDAQRQQRQQLCEELESAIDGLESIEAVRQREHAFQEAWQALEVEGERIERALEDRSKAVIERLEARIRQLHQQAERQKLDWLGELAGLCLQLEGRVIAGEQAQQGDLEAIKASRDALVRQLGENPLQQRFEGAEAALQGDQEAAQAIRDTSAENHRQKAELCLRIEILAGIDSPPEVAQERMAYQVERLNDAMRAGKSDSDDELQAICRSWYALGHAGEGEQGLGERFAKGRGELAVGG